MRKITSLFLILCMILATGITAGASAIHARSHFDDASAIKVSEEKNVKDMNVSNGSFGQYFKTDGIISKISVFTASYGNSIGGMKIQVYQWNKDYNTTVAGKVLAEEEFIDFLDNYELVMKVADKGITGEILVLMTGTKEKVAVWGSYGSYKAFYNGTESEYAARMKVYVKNGADKDGINNMDNIECEDPYAGIDVTKTTARYNSKIVESSKEGETLQVLAGTKEKFYAAYAVDFGDEPPKGAIIDIYNETGDIVKVQIIADNLETGEILCEFRVEVENYEEFWETIPAKINTKLTGKHIIYYTVDGLTVDTASIKFTKDTPYDSKDEARLKDFEETKDFEITDTYSDTWTFTDLLGRKSVTYEEAGEYNPDKQVGLFYWTWHSGKTRKTSYPLYSTQRIIDTYPGEEREIKNDYNYPEWLDVGIWNESIYGVYSGFDTWVMRKQIELFSAAGVDALFFDATNGTHAYTGGYIPLAKTLHDMHLDGIKTPGISFMFPFGSQYDYNYIDIIRVWETMYSTGLYSDTWYYFDGKPILMASNEKLFEKTGVADIDKQNEEILDFFTFRKPIASYFAGQNGDIPQWPWLQVYPQNPFGKSEKYGCECVAVGVAMNAGPNGLDAMNGKDIYGRSYTYKDGYKKLSETSKYYGYNFQEQWERARELDPEFVFVTGWNEWTAGHYEEWGQGTKGAYPDQYNDEYSRDLEPTKGEMRDVYYNLFVNEIRMFKGVRPTPEASQEKTIDLSAGFEQWADVGPDFVGYKGGTDPRDSQLLGDLRPVTNNTGRNDIVLSKVARDSENLYFYVKTAEDMSPYTDPSWMRLLINTDRAYKTGWEGYDFIINRVSPTDKTATLEKWTGEKIEDWTWEKAADVEYTLSGNEMMIKIPKSVLGISGNAIDIEFKWNDNMQIEGDIMDVYVNGDSAPVGRFAYHYITDNTKDKKMADEPVDPKTKLAHFGRRFLIMALDKNYAFAYGQKVKIDEQSDVTAPMIINDKTMVPVRFISENIGAKVKWVDETKTVIITKGATQIRLTLGKDQMRINKKIVILQSPATEIENRIYVPLRDIVEAFGISCIWEEPGVITIGPENYYMIFALDGSLDKIFNYFDLTRN